MTLVLEPNNEADYQLFVDLAKRLQVSYREEHKGSDQLTQAENDFFALAGSWQGDKSTDDLVRLIESARTTKTTDILL
ncbi:hypothetical protein GCM10027341_40090 [Spirosoma knui]